MPLDGMLRQYDEVFMRVRNRAGVETNVSMDRPSLHSSYSTHIWDLCAGPAGEVVPCGDTDHVMRAPPHGVSGWVEVGSYLDSLNA